MQFSRSFSRLVLPTVITVFSASSIYAQGRTGGNTGGNTPTTPTNPGTGNIGGSTTTQPGRTTDPSQMPGRNTPFPDMNQRGIFLSGKVQLEDGSPPPDLVTIERVCNAVIRPEGHTDSKGRFSIQLGQNAAVMMDASTSSMGDGFGTRGSGMNAMGVPQGVSERDLQGCELRASLPGFRSDTIALTGRRALDNPNVGSIILHRLAKVEGFTFSATTAMAPKDARKAFEKALSQEKNDKLDDAESNLNKAVAEYPKYAIAWFELGRVYQRKSKLDEAEKAYQKAIEADSKYIYPYANLMIISAVQKKWDKTIEATSQAIRLNPYFSPQTYFYSAVAHLNKGDLSKAEEHAREAIKMDTDHKFPKTNQLLAVILDNKGDYKGAAESMRTYLKAVPNAPDALVAQQQLADMEKKSAQ